MCFLLKISPQFSLIEFPAPYFLTRFPSGRAFTWCLFSFITEFNWRGFFPLSLLLVFRCTWTKEFEAASEGGQIEGALELESEGLCSCLRSAT